MHTSRRSLIWIKNLRMTEPFTDSNLKKAGRGQSPPFMPRTCPGKSKTKRRRFGGLNPFRMWPKNQIIKPKLNRLRLQRDQAVVLVAYTSKPKKKRTISWKSLCISLARATSKSLRARWLQLKRPLRLSPAPHTSRWRIRPPLCAIHTPAMSRNKKFQRLTCL